METVAMEIDTLETEQDKYDNVDLGNNKDYFEWLKEKMKESPDVQGIIKVLEAEIKRLVDIGKKNLEPKVSKQLNGRFEQVSKTLNYYEILYINP
jgi:hypothetical protein